MPRPAVQPVDVALRDGSTVRVREVRAGDVDGLRALLAGMSDDSRWLRFLSAGANLDKAAAAGADPGDGAGLVVTAGSPERIVAHAMYAKESPERAELAFEVADELHGRGIATILLAHLAGVAAADGVGTFVAYVHPSNRRMIGVFRQSGFPVEVHSSAGELEVVMPAALGEAARARFEDRGRAAAAAAVAHVLRPASVVLVTVGGTAVGEAARAAEPSRRRGARALPALVPVLEGYRRGARPTWRRSRTCSCASPSWPTRTRRCSGGRLRARARLGRRRRRRRRPHPRAAGGRRAVPGAGPLSSGAGGHGGERVAREDPAVEGDPGSLAIARASTAPSSAEVFGRTSSSAGGGR